MYNTVLDLVGFISFSTPMHDTSTSFVIRAHCLQLFNYFRKQSKNLNKNVQSPQQYAICTSKEKLSTIQNVPTLVWYMSQQTYTDMIYKLVAWTMSIFIFNNNKLFCQS